VVNDTDSQLCDFEAVRGDGTIYPIQLSLQVTAVSEIPKLVVIGTDVTDRRNLENQLQQARKMESIGQLAAGIAHEINTPAQFVGDNLRFIRSAFTDLLTVIRESKTLVDSLDFATESNEKLAKAHAAIAAADLGYLLEEVPLALDQSLEGVSRVTFIVNAMKEFSYPGGKNMELIDLNRAIRNTIAVASNEWKYVADLEQDLDEDLPPVMCILHEINQVILNLIVNAAHAIKEVTNSENGQRGKISVSTRNVGEMVEIRITDSGSGIPDSIKDRIFEPFFTTKEVGVGTGQGLSIAYKVVVEAHKGTIRAESAYGSGSTFVVCLPIEQSGGIRSDVAA
jgi:signal transduction histidine kinase